MRIYRRAWILTQIGDVADKIGMRLREAVDARQRRENRLFIALALERLRAAKTRFPSLRGRLLGSRLSIGKLYNFTTLDLIDRSAVHIHSRTIYPFRRAELPIDQERPYQAPRPAPCKTRCL